MKTIQDKDKETFNNITCKFCSNKNHCNLDKFKVIVIGDKVTMRCEEYVYEK